MSPDVFARLERKIPALLSSLRKDFLECALCREFTLLKKTWTYEPARHDEFIYYFEDLPQIYNQVRILQNLGLVQDIGDGETNRYLISEELAEYLTSPCDQPSANQSIEKESAELSGPGSGPPKELGIGQSGESVQADHSFRRQGAFWTITFDGKTIIIKDSKGLNYIAHLLRTASTTCLAEDLFAGTAGATEVLPIGSAGSKLDSIATRDFRSRAEELESELAEAERNNDRGRKEMLQHELEQLSNQLLDAKGIGGRDRESNNDRERIRKSVSMAIGRSVKDIQKHHPALADHLTRYIDRGHFLRYSGDIDWQF